MHNNSNLWHHWAVCDPYFFNGRKGPHKYRASLHRDKLVSCMTKLAFIRASSCVNLIWWAWWPDDILYCSTGLNPAELNKNKQKSAAHLIGTIWILKCICPHSKPLVIHFISIVLFMHSSNFATTYPLTFIHL